MSKTFDRLHESLKQALAFAKGDCDHAWSKREEVEHGGLVLECQKCGVRITTYPPIQ